MSAVLPERHGSHCEHTVVNVLLTCVYHVDKCTRGHMVESSYLAPAPQFRLKVVHKNASVLTIVQCLKHKIMGRPWNEVVPVHPCLFCMKLTHCMDY